MFKNLQKNQSGFTLVEVIVSTAIFIMVVSAMLSMFNYTLQINRRVQALREVVQSSRAFTETITREVRNGRIDYSSWTPECDADNYALAGNQSLALVTRTGDKLCFYMNNNNFMLKKQTPTATTTDTVFASTRFKILPDTFRFYVYPKTDPNESPYPEQQPYVTVVAQFELTGVNNTPIVSDYQTTISTDVYDIFNPN